MKIKSVTIQNFKGIVEPLTLEFHNGVNLLVGQNGIGKTSVLDAVWWVLFGKNSEDSQKFGILNVHDASLVPSVLLQLEIDGETHDILKMLKKGATYVEIDGVPRKVTEYEAWLKGNGIDPVRFKMFSSPTYVCEMQWEKARQAFMNCFAMPEPDIIYKATGAVSEQFKADMQKFRGRVEDCQIKYDTALKTTERQKTETGGKLKATEEQLAELAGRDPKKLKAEREALHQEIKAAEEEERQYGERVKAWREKQCEIDLLHRKCVQAEGADEKQQSAKTTGYEVLINTSKRNLEALREEYIKIAAKKPSENCPVCKQAIPKAELEQALKAHQAMLNSNIQDGKELKTKIEKAEKELEKLKKQSPYSKDTVEMLKEYELIKAEFSKLANPADEKPVDLSVQRQRVSELDKLLARADLLQDMKGKKAQYEAELKKLASELADIETLIYTAKTFVNKRAELVVKAINKKLGNGAQIQLFEVLKNGSLKDTFVITKNGVPYSDLNSTGKVEVGLTITGFIKQAMDVKTPVIIDNFERYPNLVLPEKEGNQYILAMAEKNTKTLKVQHIGKTN